MPDGVVWWFDARDGEGRIVHSGRVFAVQAEDMERSARVPGVRVHFDVDSRAPGTATNVTLRPGMRVSRRQRRFGDLTGASRADTKGPAAHAIDRPELGRDLERHPARVAENWAAMLTDGRLDDAMQFFAPNAVLHADGEIWTGATSVRSFWSRSPLLGGPDPVGVHGLDGDVFVVRWPATDAVGSETETLLTVAHGQIREQRHGRVESHGVDESVPAIDISTEGDVTDEDRARVVKAVRSVIDSLGDPVLHVSIRLRHAADPAQERPAKSRVTIDLDGEPVRAHASGTSMSEAIDRLDDRLRDRIRHVADHRRALRRRGPESPPGEWRHGDWDPPRPPFFPRPVDERSIVRHKALSPVEATVDEAIFDLEAMDHEFLLFHDLATGSDAVVSRVEGGSYAVQYLDAPAASEPAPEGVAAIEIDPRPVPDLDLDGAREHLDLTDVPWVFHRDTDTRRGAVLYRRDDGHYGWIRLADDRSESQA